LGPGSRAQNLPPGGTRPWKLDSRSRRTWTAAPCSERAPARP